MGKRRARSDNMSEYYDEKKHRFKDKAIRDDLEAIKENWEDGEIELVHHIIVCLEYAIRQWRDDPKADHSNNSGETPLTA